LEVDSKRISINSIDKNKNRTVEVKYDEAEADKTIEIELNANEEYITYEGEFHLNHIHG
jgi:hypothetical protein